MLKRESYKGGRDTLQFNGLIKFLLEEKAAMEYLQEELRDNQTVKSSVNHLEAEERDEANTEATDKISLMQKEMSNTLQKVVDGLAQVVQAVSIPQNQSQYGNTNNASNWNQSQYSNTNNNNWRKLKNCWYHESDGHDITNCTAFTSLPNQEKIELVRRNRVCFNCLKSEHSYRRCRLQKKCEIVDKGLAKCGQMHHPALHGSSFHSNVEVGMNDGENVLLMID